MPTSGADGDQPRADESPLTFFAPAGRAAPEKLQAQVADCCGHPVTDAVLDALGGVVMILNQQRQIVALNRVVLSLIGISESDSLYGLRPGEALGCVFAGQGPDGCGTGRTCRSCGAALALLASQDTGTAVERECLLKARRPHGVEDYTFCARACPVVLGDQTYRIMTLQDIHAQKQRDSLQRVFFHDLMNLLTCLHGAALGLHDRHSAPEPPGEILRLTQGLIDTVREQRDLLLLQAGELCAVKRPVAPGQLIAELEGVAARLSPAAQRHISWPETADLPAIETDAVLLQRVLLNMLKNALEATEPGGRIRLDCICTQDAIEFRVWNAGQIPVELQGRIFQRYFTTKDKPGHGLGTYSMKLIGERLLGGRVGFTSNENGTTFRIELPLA
jgi:K+-sensing histidine kinase KdpD